MAHRTIGQESLAPDGASRSGATLERLSSLVDWQPVVALLARLYPSAKGEPGWPPLSMFKALLLAVWHDVSDVKLAEALEDRASFRRFCGLAAQEATPGRIRCTQHWSTGTTLRRCRLARGWAVPTCSECCAWLASHPTLSRRSSPVAPRPV